MAPLEKKMLEAKELGSSQLNSTAKPVPLSGTLPEAMDSSYPTLTLVSAF